MKDDQQLKRFEPQNRKTSFTNIARAYRTSAGETVSRSTVSQRLKSKGYSRRVEAIRPKGYTSSDRVDVYCTQISFVTSLQSSGTALNFQMKKFSKLLHLCETSAGNTKPLRNSKPECLNLSSSWGYSSACLGNYWLGRSRAASSYYWIFDCAKVRSTTLIFDISQLCTKVENGH